MAVLRVLLWGTRWVIPVLRKEPEEEKRAVLRG